ncbi:hypothetical protein [Acidomonas methanolica]|uniref:DUF883 domain-containing protein n=1 Tax=Acidomonas methanolica NBRC 104435 TaxID=1231351 RepID=A0A023D3D9_ACIMT|nr:hypothetical protein [Acidomonas methanolica]GAJ28265.1 hypothetical protein Amme_017_006 [Acidomonas methanolica NBRC 104435]GBQ58236.1 hypothetical protein AA0498_2602 [Acidomonas methanolica]GEK99833.1 hypothetical protein AME01nite_23320 [Acidomonas methanolica NBRC 104435]
MGKDIKTAVESATKTTQEQIDSLKEQLEALLSQRINPALLEAADKADHAVAHARELRDQHVKSVTTKVRAQPIAAVLISSLVGFVAGRLSK